MNTCNYSDNFQPYIGDYDKFEYDIKLTDGRIIENCYPNARKFNSISDDYDGQEFTEDLVSEIRFSKQPRYMINEDVSETKSDPDYLDRLSRTFDIKSGSIYDNYLDIAITKNNEYGMDAWFNVDRPLQYVRIEPKINRNDICPKCDSGKKYKKCCITNNKI